MGANTDPQSMRAAVDQLEAAKRSRSERAGSNERREKKAPPKRPLPEFGEQEGRPGIRPPKPPRDEPNIPGRPPGGRDDVRIQPFPFPGEDIVRPLPYPPRGDDQYGPGRPFPGFPGRPPTKPFPGRPIGDDQFPPKEPPFFEGPLPGPDKPPSKPFPDKPNWPIEGELPPREPPWMDGRPPKKPPVEEHPWGREDDPNYGRKKDAWHQRRKEMEMKRKEDMWRKAKERRGGTDLGPGRGDRIPDEAFAQDKFDALRQQGGQNLERPGAAATTLQDFMAQMANLRSGGIR